MVYLLGRSITSFHTGRWKTTDKRWHHNISIQYPLEQYSNRNSTVQYVSYRCCCPWDWGMISFMIPCIIHHVVLLVVPYYLAGICIALLAVWSHKDPSIKSRSLAQAFSYLCILQVQKVIQIIVVEACVVVVVTVVVTLVVTVAYCWWSLSSRSIACKHVSCHPMVEASRRENRPCCRYHSPPCFLELDLQFWSGGSCGLSPTTNRTASSIASLSSSSTRAAAVTTTE